MNYRNNDLEKAAERLYQEGLKTKPDEKIAIITDNGPNKIIANICYDKGIDLYGKENVDFIDIESYDIRESSSPVNELDGHKYDIVIAITCKSVSHSKQIRDIRRNNGRIVSMPGTSKYDFIKAFDVDRDLMQRRAKYLDEELKKSDQIRITNHLGTDITLDLDHNRNPLFDCGDFSIPRRGGNIPFGEYAISPKGGNGTIVFSYSGITEGNCELEIVNGEIVDWNKNAEPLVKLLQNHENGLHLAEFGIGINPSIIIDPKDSNFDPKKTVSLEKAWKTIHFGFGNNTQFGGDEYSDIHKDAIILNPSFHSGEEELNWWEELENIN